MDIKVQEQKCCQLLDQLIYSTTQLTNTLVSNVVESLPQLYVKTKLYLLSCIDCLFQAVVKLQLAWNELLLNRKTAELASTKEESVMLLAKKNRKVASEWLSQSVPPPNVGVRKSWQNQHLFQ